MGNTVLLLTSDKLGSGDDRLGEVLIKSLVFKMAESPEKLRTILLYHSAVNLVKNSSVMTGDFLSLQEDGVEIKACGTCLSYYGIKEDEIVGSVTNMETIVHELMTADKVIRP